MTSLTSFKQRAKQKIKKALHWGRVYLGLQTTKEVDALYRLLYQLVHDKEQSLDLSSAQTQSAFASQWKDLPRGNALLSDPWFKDNVTRILTEEEILLKPEWFKGKEVLDAGCGNGRWSYGLAKLGANITAVDVNQVALDETKKALQEFTVRKEFIHSPLEKLSEKLHDKKFDLVFSWGVVHHCRSFNQSLHQLTQRVKEGGVLYLYLYGRESIPYEADLALFKERVIYNSLSTPEDKMAFLLKKSRGDMAKVHIHHDNYAPLFNRRLTFDEVKSFLEGQGFTGIERTIDHSELFIRAFKGDGQQLHSSKLPKKKSPFWFEKYN